MTMDDQGPVDPHAWSLIDRLRKYWKYPTAKHFEIDDPRTTESRRDIIDKNRFLRKLYSEWYQRISLAVVAGGGAVLELGSGAGFMKTSLPSCITSEIFYCRHVDVILDGSRLPVRDRSLKAIVMTDVFHHLPNPRLFLSEAVRSLKPGGSVVMVEPWVTPWSRFVYKRWHHEPFFPESPTWEFKPSGPLSGANSALPWIIFKRDRTTFQAEYPELRISGIQPMMPLAYLLSGGVSSKSLLPGRMYQVWRTFENTLRPWNEKLAMFALIILQRIPATALPAR